MTPQHSMYTFVQRVTTDGALQYSSDLVHGGYILEGDLVRSHSTNLFVHMLSENYCDRLLLLDLLFMITEERRLGNPVRPKYNVGGARRRATRIRQLHKSLRSNYLYKFGPYASRTYGVPTNALEISFTSLLSLILCYSVSYDGIPL